MISYEVPLTSALLENITCNPTKVSNFFLIFKIFRHKNKRLWLLSLCNQINLLISDSALNRHVTILAKKREDLLSGKSSLLNEFCLKPFVFPVSSVHNNDYNK